MFEQYVSNSGHLQNAPCLNHRHFDVKNTLLKVVFKLLTVWSADGMIALTKASDPRKQTGLHIMLKMARDSKFEKFWINLKCH